MSLFVSRYHLLPFEKRTRRIKIHCLKRGYYQLTSVSIHRLGEENYIKAVCKQSLVDLSVAFAVEILNLVKYLKSQHETIVSNQIGRAGTSIGANIHEAQYAHGKADFVSKLQIALKEANETSYWLLLLSKTNYIVPAEYDRLESLCRELRITLISSINTAKENK